MRIPVILLFSWFSFFQVTQTAQANGGYRIEGAIDNYNYDTLRLGVYFGKSTYLKDTAIVEKGKYVFESEESLKPGVYLLVMSPDNQFFHILISETQQRFSLNMDLNDMVNTAKFKGSEENEVYYSYLRELETRRPRADELRKLMVEDSLKADVYKKEIDKIDAEVKNFQDKILKSHPETITSFLIKASQELDVPDFMELPEADRQQKQYEYYRAHYFDNFDLADPRAMRSPLIQQKIDFFLQKLTYQMPDSQAVSMDYLLKKMQPNADAFQYYLVHFLNEAARSKRMGMDAVYVFLVDNYYAKGMAPWTEKEQLDKIMAQAESLRPILIGKVVPDLTFYKEGGEPVSIHSIKADYTILFFWDPECGHCKKSIPFVVDFYNAYKDKGIEMLAVCTKTGSDISGCWQAVKDRGMDIWINAADQNMRSRYKSFFDLKTTPQIYILNKDKEILVKKIAGEDLPKVMDELLKVKSEK